MSSLSEENFSTFSYVSLTHWQEEVKGMTWYSVKKIDFIMIEDKARGVKVRFTA